MSARIHGCHSRPPYASLYVAMPAWGDDGRMRRVVIDNRMSKSCQLDQRATHPGCAGCVWINRLDPRDAQTT